MSNEILITTGGIYDKRVVGQVEFYVQENITKLLSSGEYILDPLFRVTNSGELELIEISIQPIKIIIVGE